MFVVSVFVILCLVFLLLFWFWCDCSNYAIVYVCLYDLTGCGACFFCINLKDFKAYSIVYAYIIIRMPLSIDSIVFVSMFRTRALLPSSTW